MSNSDPLANLIDYVNTVKPYHTKIYEVLLQYVYSENVNATITESYEIDTTIINPESDSRIICPGVGWDTGPFDWNSADIPFGPGTFDFPLVCLDQNPSAIRTTVTDQLTIDIDQYINEIADTMADGIPIFHPIGWDMNGWDTNGWEGYYSPWQTIKITDVYDDVIDMTTAPLDPVNAAAATITESLVIEVS